MKAFGRPLLGTTAVWQNAKRTSPYYPVVGNSATRHGPSVGRRKDQMKFRKKPVVIEAIQFDGMGEIPELELSMIDSDREWKCSACGQSSSKHGNVKTLEGFHIACPGDWIITGVKGEHYPCKPEIFEMTYEPESAVPGAVAEQPTTGKACD